jgi:hypothetical protein
LERYQELPRWNRNKNLRELEMFRLGKYTRSLLRIVFYSMGLSTFLSQGWIDPHGSFLNNMIAGIALYLVAWFAALIIASLVNTHSGKA